MAVVAQSDRGRLTQAKPFEFIAKKYTYVRYLDHSMGTTLDYVKCSALGRARTNHLTCAIIHNQEHRSGFELGALKAF